MKDWIKNRPVISFFLLTYGISWPLFIVTFFLLPGNRIVQGTLGSLAAFAPVLAGIIISVVSGTKSGQRDKKRPAAFLAAWLFSALVLVLFVQQVRGVRLQAGMILFAGLLALLPAFVLSGAFSRRNGVRSYLSSLIRPKGHLIWYLIALFTFPAIQLTGALIMRLLGHGAGPLIGDGLGHRAPLVIALTFLNGFLYSGGINEESGWRGFALPRLQAGYPVLVSAGVVWCFWALWHLPYDIGLGTPLSGILINRLFYNLLWSILFAWVYNRTGGSILAPALFHPSMNTSGEFLPRTDAATVLFVLLTFIVILSDRMWKKLPSDHPAVHTETDV